MERACYSHPKLAMGASSKRQRAGGLNAKAKRPKPDAPTSEQEAEEPDSVNVESSVTAGTQRGPPHPITLERWISNAHRALYPLRKQVIARKDNHVE